MTKQLKPREAAERLSVDEQTLANWRWRGDGPPWRKLGEGRGAPVRYPEDGLEAWLAAQPSGGEAA